MPRLLFCIFLWCCSVYCWAQTPLESAYQNVNSGSSLPEDLLASRTAVFLKVPSVANDHPRYWKSLAREMHTTLVSLKIDAVAYYQWQDLNAGIDATNSFMQTLLNRDISQVIILELRDNQYIFTIIPTHDDPSFLDTSAATWQAKGPELAGILEGLSLAVRARGLEVANFLVVEGAEFFTDTPVFKKNRFESFQPDLKLDKLAIPVEGGDNPEELQLPENLESQAVFQHYPFQYEFVDYQKGEDLLRRAGFQYVLLCLYAPEASVKDLLDYQGASEAGSQMVYKFYMRHIISGDIYLGDEWDAASTRQQALSNHINNFKRSLKIE